MESVFRISPINRFGFSPQMFLLFQVALTVSDFTRTYETSYDTYLRPTLPNDSTKVAFTVQIECNRAHF